MIDFFAAYRLLKSAALAAALATLVTHCGRAYEVVIPGADIRRDLRHTFPLSKTYAGVAEVTLRDPTLLLDRSESRLTIGANALVTPLGLGIAELGRGRVVFSSGLAFDDSLARFSLDDVSVDSVMLDLVEIGEDVEEGIEEVIRVILEDELEGAVVYRLEPGEVRTKVARLFLRDVTIREDAIVVTLGFWDLSE